MAQEFSQKSKILFRPKRLEKKQRSKRKKIIFGALFLIISAGAIYFFFFSSTFQIKNAGVIASEKNISADMVAQVQDSVRDFFQTSFFFVRRDNLFVFQENELKDYLISKFPEISDAKIERSSEKNPAEREIKIYLTKREMAAIWCETDLAPAALSAAPSDEKPVEEENFESATSAAALISDLEEARPKEEIKKCFYVDGEGVVFEEAPLTFGALIVLLKDFSGDEISLGAKISEPKFIEFILDVRDWLAKNSDVSLAEFSIDKEDRQLRGLTSDGWQIVFNESQTAAEQGFIVKKILEQEIKDKRRDLEYVDLRIENRIYYKYRNQGSNKLRKS